MELEICRAPMPLAGVIPPSSRVWNVVFVAALIVAAGARGWGIYNTVAPARDALRYLPAARTFQELPFVDALRSVDSHPLYPMTLAGIGRLGSAMGWDSPTAWVTASQAWSSACWLGFLSLSYLAGRWIWDEKAAALGVVAMATLPRQFAYSIDLLSDNLHACLWMASFASFLAGWRQRRLAWLAVSGIAAGLAYWTRMEAVLLPLIFGAAWLAAQFRPLTRWPWRTSVAAAMVFAVGFATLGGGYVWVTGKLSPRNSSRSILGESTVGEPIVPMDKSLVAEIAGKPIPAPYDERRSPDENLARGMIPPGATPNLVPKPYDQAEGYADRTLSAALARLIYEVAQETRGWLLFLACAALLDRRRLAAGHPGWLMAGFATLGFGAMMVLLQMRAGYMAGRYLMPVMPFVAMFAMAGLGAFVQRIAELPRLPWERGWTATALASRRRLATVGGIAFLAVALSVPSFLRPLHPYRHGHVAAADWLRQHAQTDELVFDPTLFSAFLAGQPTWQPTPENADQPPVRFAVIDPSMVYRTEYHVHRAIAKVNALGRPVAQFARAPASSEVGVYIFELPNPPLTSARSDGHAIR